MNTMDELMPQALILGGISHSDLAFFRLGDMAYLYSPDSHLEPLKQNKVIARKRMSNYFEEHVLHAPHIFYQDQSMEEFDLYSGSTNYYGDKDTSRDFRLYRADERNRRKIWLS